MKRRSLTAFVITVLAVLIPTGTGTAAVPVPHQPVRAGATPPVTVTSPDGYVSITVPTNVRVAATGCTDLVFPVAVNKVSADTHWYMIVTWLISGGELAHFRINGTGPYRGPGPVNRVCDATLYVPNQSLRAVAAKYAVYNRLYFKTTAGNKIQSVAQNGTVLSVG